MIKGYKYKIYPTEEQKVLLEKHFGCCRWVYNWGLDFNNKLYKENAKIKGWMSLSNELTKLTKQNIWLKEVSKLTLVSSLSNLGTSYNNFFKAHGDFPKFKNRHQNKQVCQYMQHVFVYFDDNKIQLPKFRYEKSNNKDNRIKCIFDRKFIGKIIKTTVSRTKSGRYFASMDVDDSEELPQKQTIKNAIGLDFGLKTFITTSEGQKINNPEFYKQAENKIAKLSRKLSKKVKGSKNYNKAKIKLARKHEKVANQRKDFLHKLSHKLICENQADTICIEDLSMEAMKTRWGKKISDLSWFEFTRQLQYKADWHGKNLIKIGRFEPSSKMCSKCGHINSKLTLDDRAWKCQCGAEHDRDINAAQNIKDFGINKYQLKFVGQELPDVKPVEISC